MRSSVDPNLKIDWDSFDTVNRHTALVKEQKQVHKLCQNMVTLDCAICQKAIAGFCYIIQILIELEYNSGMHRFLLNYKNTY